MGKKHWAGVDERHKDKQIGQLPKGVDRFAASYAGGEGPMGPPNLTFERLGLRNASLLQARCLSKRHTLLLQSFPQCCCQRQIWRLISEAWPRAGSKWDFLFSKLTIEQDFV